MNPKKTFCLTTVKFSSSLPYVFSTESIGATFGVGDIDATEHPVQLALCYNNTDFPTNPSTGSTQFIGITHDFGWLQLVGFVEGGRVANEYNDLFTDWQVDCGVGVCAMFAGAVIRMDAGMSDESTSVWVMVGHPF